MPTHRQTPGPFTVLWDNDGVLVDTEGLYFQACQTVLCSVGIELTADLFQEISLRRGESVFRLAEQCGFTVEEADAMRDERNRLYVALLREQAAAVEGVEEVLRTLHGRVRMGVVTSTLRRHFDVIHANTGLTRYLDFVITHEDYEHSKPHPEPYLTAIARYDLCPERCLVIEDSERGPDLGHGAAGLACVIVRGSWSRQCEFRQASRIVENVSDVLPEILQRAGLS